MKDLLTVTERTFTILRRLCASLILCSLIIGLFGIVGWLWDIPFLVNFGLGAHPIRFNASIGFFLISIAYIIKIFIPSNKYANYFANLISITVLIYCFITLLEIIFNLELGIDDIYIKYDTIKNIVLSGSMSALTASSLLLMSIGIFRLHSYKSQILFLSVFFLGITAVSGYFLQTEISVFSKNSPPIPFNASIALMLIGIGAFISRPKIGLMKILTENTSAGRTLRLMLPVAVIFPLCLEIVYMNSGLLDINSEPLVTASLIMIVFSILLFYNARSLNHVEKLQTSERRIKSIIDSSIGGIISIDEDQNIILVNPSAEEIFGYKEVDLYGKKLDVLLPENRRATHQVYVNKYKTQEIKDDILREMRGVCSDGREIIIEGALSKTVVEGQNLINIIFRDVTNRKQSRIMMQRLAAIVESSTDGIISTDTEKRILTWNKGAERIYGYTEKEAIGQPTSFIIPADKIEEVQQIGNILLSGKSITNFETERIHRNGARLAVSISASPITDDAKKVTGFSIIVRDKSELLQKEQSLRKSGERYNALFENLLEGYALCRIKYDSDGKPIDFEYIAVNPSFKSLFGIDNIVGKTFNEVIPGVLEQNPEILQRYARVAITGIQERFETYLPQTNGWYSLSLFSPEKEYFVALFSNMTEAKQAEEALRVSEERNRAIVEAIPDLMFELNSDGVFLDFHAPSDTILYDSPSNFLQKNISEILPTNVAEQTKETIRKTLQTRKLEKFEYSLLINNIVMHSEARSIFLADDKVLLLIRDITERITAQQAFVESQRRLDFALEIAGMGVWEWNVETDTVEWSERCYDIFRINKNDHILPIKDAIANTVHPDDVPMVRRALSISLKERTILSVEYRSKYSLQDNPQWMASNGSAEYDETGTPVKMVGTVMNITTRKIAEEALRKTEEQFRLIAENTTDYISVIDTEGKRLYISPSLQKIYGNAIETSSLDTQHPNDREHIVKLLHQVVSTGESQFATSRIVTKDGETRFIDAVANPVFDETKSKVQQIVVVARDVTEQKRIEKQIQRSQRLESIGTLAGGIAHDLNNILTPIMLSLEILSKKFPDEKSAVLLSMLKSSVNRGSDMVKQVLGFARGIEGERFSIQLSHVINEIGRIIKEVFPKNIVYYSKISDDLPAVFADSTQIHQIMMNLCVNARDAMPNGGALTITAESLFLDEQYAKMQFGVDPGYYVVISVADQGIGMSAAVVDRLYEPFFTTKEFGKGTGMGLPTALAIIKGHGGFINVYSEVGKGSTFKVYLPVSQKEMRSEKQATERNYSGNGQLIMVIDDESAILEVTRQTLQLNGYAVLTANDGASALAMYATQKDYIALVITDMMMPYMDGNATIRALQTINPLVKIIAVSGFKQNGNRVDQGDNVWFLGKPYTSDKLLEAIHRAIG